MKRLALLMLLAGCGDFPDLEGAISESARAAPYPRLAPIEGLVVAAIGPARGGAVQDPDAAIAAVADPLAARIEALRRRAEILRGKPVNDQTRGNLAGS